MKKLIVGICLAMFLFCSPQQYLYCDTLADGNRMVTRYKVEIVKVDSLKSRAGGKYYIFYYKNKVDKDK